MYTGVTQTAGTCPICKKKFPVGTLVWFDATKSKPNCMAHKECFDALRAERGQVTVKTTGKIVTQMELEPPF